MIDHFAKLHAHRARQARKDLFLKLAILAAVVAASLAVGSFVATAFANANATVLQVGDWQ
jgi:hypothetical protein